MGLLKAVPLAFCDPDRSRENIKVHPEGSYMAKALIGYLNSDLRDPRLTADNSRLRARVAELEAVVLRLSEENDRLVAAHAADLHALDSQLDGELQPA